MREPVSGVVPETDHMTTIGGISSAVTSVWTATRNLDHGISEMKAKGIIRSPWPENSGVLQLLF